jgi:hypothetical protein
MVRAPTVRSEISHVATRLMAARGGNRIGNRRSETIGHPASPAKGTMCPASVAERREASCLNSSVKNSRPAVC